MKKNPHKKLVLALAVTIVAGLVLSVFALNRSGKAAENLLAGLKRNATNRHGLRLAGRADAVSHNVTLAHATISAVDNDDIIVVMDASGDLPGALTVKLKRDGANVTAGEWALVVAYTEMLADQPTEDGDPGESLVQKGTLKGSITGGRITLDANGSIASIDSLQLLVNGGTLTYDGVSSGQGFTQSSNLQNTQSSSGSLTLTF